MFCIHSCVHVYICACMLCVCAHMYALKREHVSIFCCYCRRWCKKKRRKRNIHTLKHTPSYRQVWKSFISYLHSHLLQYNKSLKKNAQIQNENKKSTTDRSVRQLNFIVNIFNTHKTHTKIIPAKCILKFFYWFYWRLTSYKLTDRFGDRSL